MSPHREKLAKACAMSDNVLLALPCHAQVSAEALKRDGVAACLLKPLTTTVCYRRWWLPATRLPPRR
ncbi:hypothetical protein LNQ03_23910 [Klebsiella pneumoniae subsp. pneumoniae]|nr:hypothetical protein [Klebsiella pneumoniae subsp. pneumoniae]